MGATSTRNSLPRRLTPDTADRRRAECSSLPWDETAQDCELGFLNDYEFTDKLDLGHVFAIALLLAICSFGCKTLRIWLDLTCGRLMSVCRWGMMAGR